MTQTRHILVTAALPYANGDIHLGHLVEYIQADIWVRFQKMSGQHCYYICGSDAHGTPIMLRAQQENITPEALVEKVRTNHQRDFSAFHIAFDNFYTTHSEENKTLATLIYERLKAKGDISTATISQAFDPEKELFLPDRFVKGSCPRCKSPGQYGDNCDSCGATYAPTDLIDPVSALSGATPIQKDSKHFFFNLDNYQEMLTNWTQSDKLQPEIRNKLLEWFEAGLKRWDISRDAPYFGFEIPGEPNKYFYVWLDAPIGYMASFKQFCKQNPDVDFEHFWRKDSDAELYHFIGKDIVYFHSLFWPAMLDGADFRTPTAIIAHGFLTVNGQKMSKSRGTFIKAQTYLNHLDPEYLRYYYATKLSDRIDDLDLNLEDFSQRINSDLVGKFINIASRCAGFIHKHFDGQLADSLDDEALMTQFMTASHNIAQRYEQREFNPAVRQIMELADLANQYIAQKEPWKLIKLEGKKSAVQRICTQGLNLFRLLSIYLKPILPHMVEKIERFLNIEPLQWMHSQQPLLSHNIKPFTPLGQRIQPESLEALQEEAKATHA